MPSPEGARTNTGVSLCNLATRPASCTPLPGGLSAMITAVSRACAGSIASSVWSRWSRQRTGFWTTLGSESMTAPNADWRYSRRMSGARTSSRLTRSTTNGSGASGPSTRPTVAAFTSSACSQALRASSSRMASVRGLSPQISRSLGSVRNTRETRARAVVSAALSAFSNQASDWPMWVPRQWSACLGSSMSVTRCGCRSGSVCRPLSTCSVALMTSSLLWNLSLRAYKLESAQSSRAEMIERSSSVEAGLPMTTCTPRNLASSSRGLA